LTTEPKISPDDFKEIRAEVDTEQDIAALRGLVHDLLDDLEAAYVRLGVAYERLDGAGR
jgi:hypothetical protein